MIPSASLVPTETLDPIALEARLTELRKLQLEKRHFQAPAGLSEAELASLREAHETYLASLVREQISIIARLRRTSAGPAKKGGKRGKAATQTADLSDLLT